MGDIPTSAVRLLKNMVQIKLCGKVHTVDYPTPVLLVPIRTWMNYHIVLRLRSIDFQEAPSTEIKIATTTDERTTSVISFDSGRSEPCRLG